MERMHPQDLRALVAIQLVAAGLCTNRPKFTDPVMEADDLLAELERTAPKPEPNPGTLEHWRQEVGKANARAEIAEAHDREGTAIMGRLEGMLAESKARVADLEDQARTEGARAERERIITLLDGDVGKDLRLTSLAPPERRFLFHDELRAALTPKDAPAAPAIIGMRLLTTEEIRKAVGSWEVSDAQPSL